MEYDLTIIGAGWAGFNAALCAKGLGLKTCIVEQSEIGGTCLNSGCIPTKTLIHSAKTYNLAKKTDTFGITTPKPSLDFNKIMERKAKIIRELAQGMHLLLKGIDYINSSAQLLSNCEVKTEKGLLKTKYILIATGSKPMELSDFKFDGGKIISSNEILKIQKIPASLLIIGGGVIGCEFASLFATFGSRVTVIEKMPQLLPGEDQETARKLEAIFKKKGIAVRTNTEACLSDLKDYELTLVCVGRKAETSSIDIDKAGIRTEKGSIAVDDYLKTNVENIFAAGDCTGKIMLAHFAAYQGRRAAENIALKGKNEASHPVNVPNCIFSEPEIASIGLTEEKAKNNGIEPKVYRFDFRGIGMARIIEESDGFVKIISDRKTDSIVGASIIGPKATELIAILTLAISSRLKISQLQSTIFAHPTLSESIGEAVK